MWMSLPPGLGRGESELNATLIFLYFLLVETYDQWPHAPVAGCQAFPLLMDSISPNIDPT